jgi:peptide deformylase
MIRPILRYGDRVVHEPAAPVAEITSDIRRIIDDMIETMYAAPGVGLAAPQIGVPLRIFVSDVSAGRDPAGLLTIVNPEFVERDGLQTEDEGCLSLPGFNATVARPMRVVVSGLDREGNSVRHEGTGLRARVFQHEIDHLEGRLFVDRLRGVKRELILRRIRKLQRSGQW